MDLYLINIGLIAVVLLVLVLVTLRLRWWRSKRLVEIISELNDVIADWREANMPLMEHAGDEDEAAAIQLKLKEVHTAYGDHYSQWLGIARLVRRLNAATTIASAIPLAFAFY